MSIKKATKEALTYRAVASLSGMIITFLYTWKFMTSVRIAVTILIINFFLFIANREYWRKKHDKN